MFIQDENMVKMETAVNVEELGLRKQQGGMDMYVFIQLFYKCSLITNSIASAWGTQSKYN